MKRNLIICLAVLFVGVTNHEARAVTVIDFEDLPDASFFNGGGQNIGTFYPGLTFGPDVTGLSVSRFGGYSNDAFPPHSGDVVVWSATSPDVNVSFENALSSIGIWYTSFDPLTLSALDIDGNVLGTEPGLPNTDGTVGTSSFLSFSGTGIQSIIVSGSPGLFTFDDLTSSSSVVPELNSLALLSAGLFTLLLLRYCSLTRTPFTESVSTPRKIYS